MSLNLRMTFSGSVAVTVYKASLYPLRFQNRKPEHISAEDRTFKLSLLVPPSTLSFPACVITAESWIKASPHPPHPKRCLYIWNIINHSHCYRVDLAARGSAPKHTYHSVYNYRTELPLKSRVTMGEKRRFISLTPLTTQHHIFPTQRRGRNQSG